MKQERTPVANGTLTHDLSQVKVVNPRTRVQSSQSSTMIWSHGHMARTNALKGLDMVSSNHWSATTFSLACFFFLSLSSVKSTFEGDQTVSGLNQHLRDMSGS